MARNRMIFVGAYVPEKYLTELDEIADDIGISRSAAIRKAIEELTDRWVFD